MKRKPGVQAGTVPPSEEVLRSNIDLYTTRKHIYRLKPYTMPSEAAYIPVPIEKPHQYWDMLSSVQMDWT